MHRADDTCPYCEAPVMERCADQHLALCRTQAINKLRRAQADGLVAMPRSVNGRREVDAEKREPLDGDDDVDTLEDPL